MIDRLEKEKMLSVPMCGKRTVELLEVIGMCRLSDLRGEDAAMLKRKIEVTTGHAVRQPRRLIAVLSNLINAAIGERDLSERDKLLRVPLCGERVIERLKSIGIERLADLKGKNPYLLMHEINLVAGRSIWRPPMAIIALTNLIKAAEGEHPRGNQSRKRGSK